MEEKSRKGEKMKKKKEEEGRNTGKQKKIFF